ncbi:hypothetical protein [Spirosoma rhododendri]|uniref:Uncharacterized protein n=1 Tax=Spirosoma rhododendri TaxID=2728024 RepID=A0A7L5DQL8_9BACT|nr:hypothetical protein [Spirosoma rhododendri]QJD79892.1 hypothetical protein HH216_16825 [Spirosoma rhododendri]
MAIVIDDTLDLIFLQKALTFIKFSYTDYDAQYLAGSPSSGKLLERVSKELEPYYQKIKPDYRLVFGSIEDDNQSFQNLKIHLAHINDWNMLDMGTKAEVLRTLATPFSISKATVEQLSNTD